MRHTGIETCRHTKCLRFTANVELPDVKVLLKVYMDIVTLELCVEIRDEWLIVTVNDSKPFTAGLSPSGSWCC